MANSIHKPKTRTYHVETKDSKKTLCGSILKKAPNRFYYKFRNELLQKDSIAQVPCKDCLKQVKAIRAQKKIGL